MVVAIGPKGELGKDNKLLWHIPDDLKNFKKLTTGKVVVMGRKTYESIGKPLPNRTNVVITRDESYKPEGVIVCHDPMMVFDVALELDENDDSELMVIGGADIFNIFMPYTQRIYLSMIPYEGPADVYFPELIKEEWQELESEERNGFTYKVLERI